MNENRNIPHTASEQGNAGQQPAVEQAMTNENPSAVQIQQPTTNKQSHPIKDTLNQNAAEAQKMEVHHAHHPTHKKKWTEYLLEFFMLFLAVFLGFVAENIREGQVERHHEKEYIESMIDDLKTDTAKINRYLPWVDAQLKAYDSLVTYLVNEPYTDSAISYIYYLDKHYYHTYFKFTTTTRTINQLNNAGGMRLIKSKVASDSIINYYTNASLVQGQFEIFKNGLFEAYKTTFSIFKAKVYHGVTRATAYKLLASRQTFADASPEKLNVYANEVNTTLGQLTTYKNLLSNQRETCISLLKALQNEYHLGQE